MTGEGKRTRTMWQQRESVRWILSLATFFALWMAIIWIFRFPEYVLPSPLAVARILWQDASLLLTHTRMTVFEAVVGFFYGIEGV